MHGEAVGNQAQETLEEFGGYRLGKRNRRPLGGAAHGGRKDFNGEHPEAMERLERLKEI